MIITAIFLITCIITARLLEKKKMSVASIIYSVMFVILITALLFTSDLVPVCYIFESLMGVENYMHIKNAIIYVINTPLYGTAILFAFFITLFIQVVLSFIYLITTLVKHIKICEESYFPNQNNYKCSYIYQTLCLKKNINLLYCRMLN